MGNITKFGVFIFACSWTGMCFCQDNKQLFSNFVEAHHAYRRAIESKKGFVEKYSNEIHFQAGQSKPDFYPGGSSRKLLGFSNDCRLFESQANTDDPSKTQVTDTVYSIGNRYSFSLRKPGGTDRWELFKYLISDDPDLDLKNAGLSNMFTFQRPSRMELNEDVSPVISGATRLQLYELVDQPGFVVTAVIQKPESDEVQVNFQHVVNQYIVYGFGTFNNVPFESELVLDSANYYLPTHLLETAEIDGNQHRIETTIVRVMEGGLSSREEIESTASISNGGENVLTSTDKAAVDYEYRHLPDEEFTLSAYGFPEPSELKRGGWKIPTHIWLLLVGVASVGIAVFLKIRSNWNRS